MQKFLLATLSVLLFLLFSGQLLFAEKNQQINGTIRGGVYLDADGDGQCADTDTPIPNIDLSFNQNNDNIILYSGTNGTYGLATAPQGIWTVAIHPNSNEWQVASAPSQQVNVSNETGLVQLNVNFCLRPVIGGSSTTNESATLPTEDVIAVAEEQVDSSIAAPTTEPKTNSEVSESLLTSPPEPEPHPHTRTFAQVDPLPIEADWLAYLNLFREMGNLPHLTAEDPLSEASQLHSRYMVMHDEPIAHKENPSNDLYTDPGNTAAHNSNIFSTTQIEADHKWATNFWISAPFHQVPLIDPELTTVGYGNYNNGSGTFNMAAVLDVLTDAGDPNHNVDYPIYFPAQDSETWIVRHSLYEWPDPLTACPGYVRPTGPPIVLQIGDGSQVPNVTSYKISIGDLVLDSCLLHESNYVNPDAYAQETGRIILNERDAIVIMPRIPLEKEREYVVEIVANGVTYVWAFNTTQPPTTE